MRGNWGVRGRRLKGLIKSRRGYQKTPGSERYPSDDFTTASIDDDVESKQTLQDIAQSLGTAGSALGGSTSTTTEADYDSVPSDDVIRVGATTITSITTQIESIVRAVDQLTDKVLDHNKMIVTSLRSFINQQQEALLEQHANPLDDRFFAVKNEVEVLNSILSDISETVKKLLEKSKGNGSSVSDVVDLFTDDDEMPGRRRRGRDSALKRLSSKAAKYGPGVIKAAPKIALIGGAAFGFASSDNAVSAQMGAAPQGAGEPVGSLYSAPPLSQTEEIVGKLVDQKFNIPDSLKLLVPQDQNTQTVAQRMSEGGVNSTPGVTVVGGSLPNIVSTVDNITQEAFQQIKAFQPNIGKNTVRDVVEKRIEAKLLQRITRNDVSAAPTQIPETPQPVPLKPTQGEKLSTTSISTSSSAGMPSAVPSTQPSVVPVAPPSTSALQGSSLYEQSSKTAAMPFNVVEMPSPAPTVSRPLPSSSSPTRPGTRGVGDVPDPNYGNYGVLLVEVLS